MEEAGWHIAMTLAQGVIRCKSIPIAGLLGTHQCIVVFTGASERHFTVTFALDNAAVFHDKEESNCNQLQTIGVISAEECSRHGEDTC